MKPEMQFRRTTPSEQTPPKTGRKGTRMSLDSNHCVDIEAVKLSLMVSIFLNIRIILSEMKCNKKVSEFDRGYQTKMRVESTKKVLGSLRS